MAQGLLPKVREGGQGWTDSQMVISLVLLNLAGGDCVEDIKVLEGDDGFCEILRKSERHGLRWTKTEGTSGTGKAPA